MYARSEYGTVCPKKIWQTVPRIRQIEFRQTGFRQTGHLPLNSYVESGLMK